MIKQIITLDPTVFIYYSSYLDSKFVVKDYISNKKTKPLLGIELMTKSFKVKLLTIELHADISSLQ